jgi:signal transduction histidine kinase
MAGNLPSPRQTLRDPMAVLAFCTGAVCASFALFTAISPGVVIPATYSGLLVLALGTLAMGLREYSARRQFETERKARDAAIHVLEEKNHWLNLTEAHAMVGHWRLDLAADRVFWSDATFAIHGLAPGNPPALEEALGFFPPGDREIVEANVENARRTGEPYAFRAKLIDARGETRYVEAHASVEKAYDGTPVALFGVLKDRTNEEYMQNQLRQANAEALELANSKGQFLARMSHEIRTPMNGVLGFAELLGRSDLDTEQRRQVDFINESGKSLQTILNDILDLSKIGSGKVDLKPCATDIPHLVHRVTQVAEPSAREKGIGLVRDVAPDIPRHVKVDALRLRQALSNLIANAVRFTDEGEVSVSLRRVEGALRFAVSDTGTGIAPSMLKTIFDPFTQEHNHPIGSRGGTGLGLAISRQLAELMGGSLTVESELGRGSVFTLTIPLIEADAPLKTFDNAPSGKTARSSSPGGRILLAEDYDINRELITEMTRQMGVEMDCAENGVEAVRMVHHARTIGRPYALVLMDLQMPRLDGLGAAERLRSGGVSASELPIIALTANAFADDIRACLAAGMQAHLAKPLSMERLSIALEQWMPGPDRLGPHAERTFPAAVSST